LNLNNLRGRKDGNSWSSGLAPPPPPGTPPARKANPNRNSGGNNSPSDGSAGGGSNKSGIGAGGIAGIVISIFVVGAIVAFFLMKRRSRRSSSDIEKFDNQPFAPLVSNEVQGKVRICILQFYIFFPSFASFCNLCCCIRLIDSVYLNTLIGNGDFYCYSLQPILYLISSLGCPI